MEVAHGACESALVRPHAGGHSPALSPPVEKGVACGKRSWRRKGSGSGEGDERFSVNRAIHAARDRSENRRDVLYACRARVYTIVT